MQGVGPGTVLGGRYALRHRFSQGRDLESWAAHDATLEREVALTIVGSKNPNRAGVLDAARRAAGVEDARLVRILDVGTQNDNSFIVEEAMNGSESLAAILLQGPLPAEEARRVAGEAAKGLETAGQRGLHHLRLTPNDILVAPDGAIRVRGTAVAAAIDGPDLQEPDADTASRRDALCLVAIVYAALTSRWPLDEEVPGMERAPRTADGSVAPSEIAAGVPGDLDALCRMTLNEATGPATPGEFAHRIAPWTRERIHRAMVEPTVVIQLPGSDALPAEGDSPGGPVPERKVEPTVLISTGHLPTEIAGESDGKGGQGDSPTDLASHFIAAEPPLPLLPASTAQPPSRGQSKIVVVVVATFVALAMFLGYRGLFGSIGPSLSRRSPTPTRTAAAATAPSAKVPAAKGRPAAAARPIAILSATGFDPEGDQRESNSQAPRVYDGNLSTSWRSSLYNTAQFGALKKGVGVLLDLGQPTSVRHVSIELGNGPVDVTAYAASDTTIQGATVIGTASGANGRVELKADGAVPKGRYVIVWFTNLAPDGGRFSASISEIALS